MPSSPASCLGVLLLVVGCGPAVGVDPPRGDLDGGLPHDDGGMPTLKDRFARGGLDHRLASRVAAAGLRVRTRGGLVYVLGISRDEEGRERRRLSVRAGEAERWSFAEPAGERIADFAVHPSGAVSLGVERLDAPHDALSLLRLDGDGRLVSRQPLERPEVPEGDLQPGLPPRPFAMKGVTRGSVVRGWLPWLRLEPRGEGLVIGLLTFADEQLLEARMISSVMELAWSGAAYQPRWARVVDDVHSLLSVAWQYDDFLLMDAASRLVVSVTDEGVVVGRTLLQGRCTSLVRRGEATSGGCRTALLGSGHRYQPFTWTRFGASGQRLGSTILAPSAMEDFVVFDLAARGGEVAVAGGAVRLGARGEPDYYYEPPGATDGTPLVPFDGYLAVMDAATGAPRFERFIDTPRATLLAALRWTDDGLLAAGATDWNRWWGGMSVSRGADPLLVLLPHDGGPPLLRTIPVGGLDRHAHLLSIDQDDRGVIAVGPGDAPLTHSGDARPAEMALGALEVTLR